MVPRKVSELKRTYCIDPAAKLFLCYSTDGFNHTLSLESKRTIRTINYITIT